MNSKLCLIVTLFLAANVAYAGKEEEVTKTLIQFFKQCIKNDHSVEVSNANHALCKGKVRLAVSHLLIASIDLTHVDMGTARVHYAQKVATLEILKEMVEQLSSEKSKKEFTDNTSIALLFKAREQLQ